MSGVLFPPATALDGGYQRKMQQFNALIHSLPEMDQRKSIHSFRHNFDTELLNKGAQEYFILCLDGHTRTGELMSRYANLRNIERDKKNEVALKKLGWHVIIVWECKIKQTGYLHRLARSICGSHHSLSQKYI